MDYQVGERVQGAWRPGSWYDGQIIAERAGTFHVQFDDGDEGWYLPDRLRRPGEQRRVLAQWGDGGWHAGVAATHDGRELYIQFDDGDTGWIEPSRAVFLDELGPGLPPVGTVVWARWNGGSWYPGRVDAVEADRVHVQFDDGDRGWAAAGEVVAFVDGRPQRMSATPDTEQGRLSRVVQACGAIQVVRMQHGSVRAAWPDDAPDAPPSQALARVVRSLSWHDLSVAGDALWVAVRMAELQLVVRRSGADTFVLVLREGDAAAAAEQMVALVG